MRISTLQHHTRAFGRIADQQQAINRVQEQLSSGRRILNASDDPIGAARSLNLRHEVHRTEQYMKNADVAERELRLEETTIERVDDIINRVRELTIQGGNGTIQTNDRIAIAKELGERLKELDGLANTQSANGEYLFGGYQGRTRPFTVSANGSYQYNGDEGQRMLQIGSAVEVSVRDSGQKILVEIKAGANSISTQVTSGNRGLGVIGVPTIVDPTAWEAIQPASFTITFNALNPGSNYDVTDGTGSIVSGMDDVSYSDGASIAIAGARFAITGAPQPGDSFTLRTPVHQDIFKTIQQIKVAFESLDVNGGDQARLDYEVATGLSNLDGVQEHLTAIRADIGARMNVVDNQREVNEGYLLITKESLSKEDDLDYAKAAGELNQLSFALEAAQQSFVKTQGLSLFNYL